MLCSMLRTHTKALMCVHTNALGCSDQHTCGWQQLILTTLELAPASVWIADDGAYVLIRLQIMTASVTLGSSVE